MPTKWQTKYISVIVAMSQSGRISTLLCFGKKKKKKMKTSLWSIVIQTNNNAQ